MEKSSAPLRPSSSTEAQVPAASRSSRCSRRRRCLVCCGAVTVVNVLAGVILMLTVFKARSPVARVNKFFVVKFETINGTKTPLPGSNATFIFDVSLKNRNFVSLKHPNITAEVRYQGAVIGEASMAASTMVARRTTRGNATLEVIMDRVSQIPGLDAGKKVDVIEDVKLITRWFRGRVKFLFMKKHLKLKMRCAVSINITSLDFLNLKCKSKFKL